MSDNEQQPPTPQLTRRQLRELRNTASNPIIVDPDATDDASATGAEPTPAPAPLPRAAEPVEVPPAPVPQTSVDLGSPALTRRQARLQEKIRTASIPVVTATGEHPTVAAESDDSDASGPHDADEAARAVESDAADEDAQDRAELDAPGADGEAEAADGADAETEAASPDVTDAVVETESEAAGSEAVEAEQTVPEESIAEHDIAAHEIAEDDVVGDDERAIDETADEEEPERHVVSNDLGADLLAGESAASDVPASFDQLLSRSAAATGAFTTPNALILAENPDGGPLVAPVTATGEVLITGTFTLPENFGSTGVVPGVADGKEVDAVLVDGELPASSSPTPIAASAAISTIKSAEDVIRPPAPEKGSRWTVALAITAGALALALAGVLLVSLFTGVFG
ncbi:hypothetical protein ACLBWJ_01535 [Microbacterium sp. M4A5_1d]|uniref:hypothetical protein n=1 Tax=Microbacterium sp. BDGP8 TaxID=3035531 RepID=UPI00249EC3C8|nr:hypothetical protein [Microbacterium sp. BDGP8]WHE34710.1 hypothetical protein P6897_08225 [Microbacterium sp. BDGP8]